MAAKSIVKVTAPKGGRRRGGRRWDEGVTEVPASKISKAAIEALQADPDFTVEILEGAAPNPPKNAKDADTTDGAS